MARLTLWGRASAFNVQKALWLLGELGLPFDHEQVGGAHGGLDAPEFLRINPHGRVPVLRDGDTIVWESHSILRYLAARYGSEALWPAEPAARSLVDRWMDWSLASLQPAFMRLFWGYFRTPQDLWDRAGLQPAIEKCDRLFMLLDGQLAGRAYLAGSAFSLADIPAGTTLYRYFGIGLAVPHHPNVDAWYGRLCARKAYQQAIMVPFEDLRGRMEY
jgi:glutathione S-transferase